MTDTILKSDVLKRGYGTLQELKQELSDEDIRHLQLGGYIENGIAPNVGETFRLTKSGKDMLYLYSDEISLKDRLMGWFLHYILGYKVAL